RRVDGAHRRRVTARDQNRGKGAIAAADVQPAHTLGDSQPIKECFTDEAAPTAYALFIGFAICEKLFILAHARHQPTINKKLTRLFWSHIFASPGPTLMAQVAVLAAVAAAVVVAA